MHALLKDTDAVYSPHRSGREAPNGGVRLSQGNKTTISGRAQDFQGGRAPVMPPGRVVDEFAYRLGAPPRQGLDTQPMKAGLAQHVTGLPIERAVPRLGKGHGAITRRFVVLVEGAVHNEPADRAARNHAVQYIVLERNIAERGHFPSINTSQSISRATPGCNTPIEQSLALRIQARRGACEDMAECIRFGARKAGMNGELDMATELYPHSEVLQTKDEGAAFTECYAVLEKIKGSTPGKGDGS